MPSVIESHPKRAEIDAALLAGKSLAKVCKIFNLAVATSTLNHYRHSVLIPAISTAHKVLKTEAASTGVNPSTMDLVNTTVSVSAAKPVLDALRTRKEKRDRWEGKAETAEDYRALSAFDRNGLSDLRTVAELTGALDQQHEQAVQDTVGVHVHYHSHEHHHEPAESPQMVDMGDVVEVVAEPVDPDT